jgi:hypothetical protein
MAMPRKSERIKSLSRVLQERKTKIPKRITLFAIIRDESGSMSRWRNQQGQFIPSLTAGLREVAGPNFINSVYVQFTVICGGHVSSAIGPIDKLSDTTFVPDGNTPLGTSLSAVANDLQSFIDNEVHSNDVTIRNFEILLISDCLPAGETASQTKEGVAAFTTFATKYQAKIQIVVPADSDKKNEWVQALNISDREVRTLQSNPADLINVTFESLVAASVQFGRSNPNVRN